MGCGVSKASAQPYRTVEIGHFRVNKILGKGSFGKVCVIERLADGHLFALKYSDKEKALRDKAIPYIVQERNMLEEFRHTLICGLRYSFQDEKFMYMILDMMSGGDLRFHIKSRLWNQDETTFVIAEISCALGYLHSHKIVHRDIKPDNILLDADGHAHLSDFNVAIRYVEGKPLRSVAGTEPYMAPEIIIGTGYTMAVDWWSLGVTMFEMVCGERPFRTKLRRKLIRKAKYKFPEPLVGNGTLSELCKSVITAMLQLDPKKRLGNRLNGASTLQNHPLFMNLDWNHINTKTAKPVFVPSMTTSNFKTDATTDDLIDFINQKRRTFQENDVSNSLFRGFSYFDYTLNSTESHEAQTLSFSNKSDPVDFNEYEYTDRVNTTFDTTDSSGINRLQSFLSQLSTKQKVGRSVLSSLGVGGLTQRHSNRSYQMPLEDQPRSILQITASASTAHQISVGCTGPSHVVHLSPLAKSISTGSSLIADNAYNQEPEHPIDNIHDVHDCSVQYHSHPLAHLSCPKEPLDMNYSFAGEGETPAQLCARLDAVTEDTSTTTSTSGTTTTPVVVSAPPLARTPTNTVRNQSKSRQCRNVLIHGHCKFEGKGGQFLHEVSPKASPAASVGPGIITKDNWDNRPRPGSAAIPIMPHPTSRIGSATDVSAAAATTNPTTTGTTTGQKISVASPVFTPSRTPLVAAAVTEAQPIRSIPSLTYSPQQLYGSSTQTPELMPHLSQPDPARYHQQYGYGFYDQADQYAGMHMIQGGIKSMGLGQQQSNMQEQCGNYQDNAQLENFFMHQQTNTPYLPLQYHLYNSALPKVSNLPSNIKSSHYFFIDDNLRENLLKRNEAVQKVVDPSVPDGPNLPITVDSYHTLFPLEDSSTPSKIFGYPTSVYKAIRSVDGKPYILRRIEGFRMMNAATMACLESWRHVRHANVYLL
ncbi:hypothetical protein BASA81_018451 [Batrachochytrium salamandrivorans]|nr:hypothetical protein BASA81_018451 [Batrachochytrium salamandrivorans]